MLPLLLAMITSTWTKYLTLAIVVFAGGVYVGHKLDGPQIRHLKSKEANEIVVKSKVGHLRSRALTKDGHTYYKDTFINKWLEAQGINTHLKNLV